MTIKDLNKLFIKEPQTMTKVVNQLADTVEKVYISDKAVLKEELIRGYWVIYAVECLKVKTKSGADSDSWKFYVIDMYNYFTKMSVDDLKERELVREAINKKYVGWSPKASTQK